MASVPREFHCRCVPGHTPIFPCRKIVTLAPRRAGRRCRLRHRGRGVSYRPRKRQLPIVDREELQRLRQEETPAGLRENGVQASFGVLPKCGVLES